ncbi:phosphotransferase enzyme family protein [Isoptericola sp. NPDC057559]|uniref:phosphotransferase enzyme family protein n=1 Tax=Isoptericola sp. NPDC057559 TaxID=3346168 RepID=UPI0036828D70
MDAADLDAAGPVASLLAEAYGVRVGRVERVPAGTATDNFVATGGDGTRLFVKAYRTLAEVPAARAAAALTEFAGRGGTPVPHLHRTARGKVIARGHGLVASVWAFVDGARTAEGGLRGDLWSAVGTAVGRLHRHLATHPSALPTTRPAAGLVDVGAATARYDRLLDEYRRRGVEDDFEAWARDALAERRALLPRVGRMLAALPPLTVQTLHGDLAAPNVLLRGDAVAAVIDFQPPTEGYLAWEVARIACDPRTLVTNPGWRDGLPALLDAYRLAHPAVRPDDLAAVVAAGSAYTLASTYPLGAPVHEPGTVDDTLRTYARQRHDAALVMLDEVTAA